MTKSQIKTLSLTSKILKLVKGLKKFTVSDIQQIIYDTESNILLSLKELEENSDIEKISQTEYLYVNKKSKEPKHHKTRDYGDKTASGEWLSIEDVCKLTGETPEEVKQKCRKNIYKNTYERDGKFRTFYIKASSLGSIVKKLNDDELGINLSKPQIDKLLCDIEYYKELSITNILKSKTDCDFYNKCDENIKKSLIKHLVLFRLVGNIPPSSANDALAIIAEKYPFYSMCTQWYKKKYTRFANDGLAGLYHNQLNTVSQDVYDEFKKIYFANKECSQETAYMILSDKMGKEKLPSLAVIAHRLRKEFTRQAIKNIKGISTFSKITSETTYQDSTNPDDPRNIMFEDAVQKYLNLIEENNEAHSRNLYVDCKRLTDFFKKYRIGEIEEKHIIKYREQLVLKGISLISIKINMSLLFKILSFNGVNLPKYKIFKNTRKIKLLSLKKINEIINTHSPEAWIIGLGLKPNEIDVLEYEDIDFKNEIATISKLRLQERKQKFYSSKLVRKIKIPFLLLSKLNPKGKGVIFNDVKIKNYEQLIFAHVMLMHLNNVPMNIIAKNMGFNVHSFYNLFSKIFPKELDKKFDIFKGVFK